MTETQKIDDKIRSVLKDASAPMLADEIADEVTRTIPCDHGRVRRRLQELPGVEQGGQLYRLGKEDA